MLQCRLQSLIYPPKTPDRVMKRHISNLLGVILPGTFLWKLRQARPTNNRMPFIFSFRFQPMVCVEQYSNNDRRPSNNDDGLSLIHRGPMFISFERVFYISFIPWIVILLLSRHIHQGKQPSMDLLIIKARTSKLS